MKENRNVDALVDIAEKKNRSISHLNLAFVACVANLGSFLFGYDYGVISWLLVSVDSLASVIDDNSSNQYFHVVAQSDTWIGLIAAGAALGALITYIFLLFFGNNMPKRDEIILAAILYFVGALLESSSGYVGWDSWTGLALLLLGRLIYGAGGATTFHAVPSYVSEIAPAELRGMVGSTTEAMISTGVVISYVVGYYFESGVGWIVSFRVAYVIAFIMALLAL